MVPKQCHSEIPCLRLEQAPQSRLGLAETGLGFQLVAQARGPLEVIIEPQR